MVKSARLEEMARRTLITWGQREAGQQWLGDLIEAGRGGLVQRRSLAEGGGCGVVGADTMGPAMRRRLREAEQLLGAPDRPAWLVLRGVVVDDRPASEVGEPLGMPRQAALYLLRWGLDQLAAVYRVHHG